VTEVISREMGSFRQLFLKRCLSRSPWPTGTSGSRTEWVPQMNTPFDKIDRGLKLRARES